MLKLFLLMLSKHNIRSNSRFTIHYKCIRLLIITQTTIFLDFDFTQRVDILNFG